MTQDNAMRIAGEGLVLDERDLIERISQIVRDEMDRRAMDDTKKEQLIEDAVQRTFDRLKLTGDKDLNDKEGTIHVEKLNEESYVIRNDRSKSQNHVMPWTYEDGQWRNPCLQVGNTIYHDPSSFSGLGGVEGDNYVNFNLSSNSISVGSGVGSNNVLSFYIGTLSGSAQVAGIYSMPVAFVYT